MVAALALVRGVKREDLLLFLVQTPDDGDRIATFNGVNQSALFQGLNGAGIRG